MSGLDRIRASMRWMGLGLVAVLLLSAPGASEAKNRGKGGGKGNGKGLALGHYKHIWKTGGSADVSAKASLRERLRAGEIIETDDDLAFDGRVSSRRSSRGGWVDGSSRSNIRTSRGGWVYGSSRSNLRTSRSGWVDNHARMRTRLDTQLGSGAITQSQWDARHNAWHRRFGR